MVWSNLWSREISGQAKFEYEWDASMKCTVLHNERGVIYIMECEHYDLFTDITDMELRNTCYYVYDTIVTC